MVRRRVVKRGTHDDVTCVHDDVTWFGGEWSREGHMKYRVPEVTLMLCDRVYHLCVCVCVCVFVCVCVSCMCCVCIYTLSVNSKQDTRGDEQVAVISPIHICHIIMHTCHMIVLIHTQTPCQSAPSKTLGATSRWQSPRGKARLNGTRTLLQTCSRGCLTR